MMQPTLDFTRPAHRARKAAWDSARGKKEAAYARLMAVYSQAGRAGLTADEAICQAGLDWRYGRPRVSELLRDHGLLVDPPDIPRRTFTYPSGVTVKPAAVLVAADAYGDPCRRILALGAGGKAGGA